MSRKGNDGAGMLIKALVQALGRPRKGLLGLAGTDFRRRLVSWNGRKLHRPIPFFKHYLTDFYGEHYENLS